MSPSLIFFMVDVNFLDLSRGSIVVCVDLGVAQCTIIVTFRTTYGFLLCHKPRYFALF